MRRYCLGTSLRSRWNISLLFECGLKGAYGVSDEVKQKLETTLKTIFDSDAYQEFMKKRGFGVKWLPSGEFAEFMKNAHENNAKVIAKLGLSK